MPSSFSWFSTCCCLRLRQDPFLTPLTDKSRYLLVSWAVIHRHDALVPLRVHLMIALSWLPLGLRGAPISSSPVGVLRTIMTELPS